MHAKHRYYVGIDPGWTNGYAIWDSKNREFVEIKKVIGLVNLMTETYNAIDKYDDVQFVIEDARMIKDIHGRRYGAGAIKTLCDQMELFFKQAHEMVSGKWTYVFVKPSHSVVNIKATPFAMITGIKRRMSQHEREAAMYVYGR